ncbi:chromosome condensation protein CrcB [Glaciecola punicea]|uniref:fluoride efflux transporter CrcB n=1 Tax=Glaciecola punicea TaxID=56804 RepID=UPI000872EB52|nr:fluoride efflux transporter CrcB [Glaciecola punicea]OFA33341.1 chromosome condensation protein CrcB [Glaciecola punicea]
MSAINTYLIIACGGAIGACLRYFLTQESIKLLGKGFPFGTLAVNVIGSFALGCLYMWIEQEQREISDSLRLFLGVGLLGALTTFSTFSYDTLLLLQQSEYIKALLNILLNVGLCIVGVWLAVLFVKG